MLHYMCFAIIIQLSHDYKIDTFCLDDFLHPEISVNCNNFYSYCVHTTPWQQPRLDNSRSERHNGFYQGEVY